MSVKFEGGSAQTLQDSSSSTLASAAALLCPTAFDNSNTSNLYFWGDLELSVTFGTAPVAAKAIECYLTYAPDGTNYSDTDNTTPNYGLSVGSFVVRNVTTAQRILIRGVPLSPWPLKGYLRNQTDQTMSAAFVLKIYPYREQ